MSTPLDSLLSVKPVTDPNKFMGLLFNIAERVERGDTHSIGAEECKQWGYDGPEACTILTLLAQAGIVRPKVHVFNDEKDRFVESPSGQDLSNVDPDRVHVWYTPCVRKGELDRFFFEQPGSLTPAM